MGGKPGRRLCVPAVSEWAQVSRLVFSSIFGGIFLFGISTLQAQQSAAASPTAEHRATLNKYCVPCHNEKLKTADLLLDKANLDNVGENPELWEKVVAKLRSGAMPPAGANRPDKTAYETIP